jgi:hypothetical protein
MQNSVTEYLAATSEMIRRCNEANRVDFSGLAVGSLAEFVLLHGREYVATRPLPDGMERGPEKLCFQNAWQFANISPTRLIYVEGFAASIFPMHHAWVVDRQGTVFDPTWEFEEGRIYFGIPISREYGLKALVRRAVWGMLDPYPTRDHFESGFDVSEMIYREEA